MTPEQRVDRIRRTWAISENGAAGVLDEIREAESAAYERGKRDGAERDETAWLIERPGPRYWFGRKDCSEWSHHDDAVRFARRVDAEAVQRTLGLPGEAREHIWYSPRPAPSAAPSAKQPAWEIERVAARPLVRIELAGPGGPCNHPPIPLDAFVTVERCSACGKMALAAPSTKQPVEQDTFSDTAGYSPEKHRAFDAWLNGLSEERRKELGITIGLGSTPAPPLGAEPTNDERIRQLAREEIGRWTANGAPMPPGWSDHEKRISDLEEAGLDARRVP